MEFDCHICSGRQSDGAEIDLTESDYYTDRNTLEIKVNGEWVRCTLSIFRSWTGERRIDGQDYDGVCFVFGTAERYNGVRKELG